MQQCPVRVPAISLSQVNYSLDKLFWPTTEIIAQHATLTHQFC